jgi:hypothetical protein
MSKEKFEDIISIIKSGDFANLKTFETSAEATLREEDDEEPVVTVFSMIPEF